MLNKFVVPVAAITTFAVWVVGRLTGSSVLDVLTVAGIAVTIGLYFLYGEVRYVEKKWRKKPE